MRKNRFLPRIGKIYPLLLAFIIVNSFSLPSFSQTNTNVLLGKVSDSKTGEGLSGASIKVKGTKNGTITDVYGAFKINAPQNATLIISASGYTELQLPAKGPLSNIRLVQVARDLDDVVVVGYGTQKKVTLTGSVATVTAKTFENRGPLSNPLAALQGEVPGVIVTRTSAQPGRENWSFQIRGATSTNRQDPLVILDGVALQSNLELNSINPADIDNISF